MDELTEEHFKIAKANGVSRKNVRQRYWDYGWDIEKSITEPIITPDPSVWLSLKETAMKNGISNAAYHGRISRGMTPEQAASTPVGKRGGSPKGLWDKYMKMANDADILRDTFYARVRKGMEPEKAATMPLRKGGKRRCKRT